MSRRKDKKIRDRKIARERIIELFQQAEDNFHLDPKLSDRHVALARKIAMKHNISIPSKLKRKFCKHCYSFLMPGENCRIRTKRGMLIIYCLKCKKFTKFKYKK